MIYNQQKIMVVISPHPDDETLCCGGVIAAAIERNHQVLVFIMTDGRYSHSYELGITSNPSPHELALIRKQEATDALRVLGVNDRNIYFLEFIDRTLHRNMKKAIQILSMNLRGRSKHIYNFFYPHRQDNHPDHLSSSIIAESVIIKLRINAHFFKYVVWAGNNNQFEGKISIPINKYLIPKQQALAKYQSQLYPPVGSSRSVLNSNMINWFTRTPDEFFYK